ncbi:LOW QUALITY PROTEIN: uncharacterized protein EMH_0087660 [Eimeria mitis]|uniref:Uncharacterized protein n=1 Tax=Eimeria mitis TaxID=44415 RepID=U6KB98_9EIME|nr:LOW QUALITY PROTEIN: uncharacterized protein EMH_0087660 [Eimeria mitis]CDJ34071.1 hypothetical protein EMH_0087660 [Eimeria mitis]
MCSCEVVSSNPLTDPFFWFSFILPDAALEAEAAERAAPGDAATEGPLGAAFSKGFNVVEYPLPPHPGSRPMRRHQARNLSYNASISDFLGAEALQRLEADCPQLRLTEQQQMRLRLLQAAAKAAATAGTTLGGATQRAAADEGSVASPASRGPPLKRLKTDAAETEGAQAAAPAAAAVSSAAAVKQSEETAAAAQSDSTVQQGERTAAAAAAPGTSGAPARNLPAHFDALYDLLLSTPQQKQQLQHQMQQQLFMICC